MMPLVPDLMNNCSPSLDICGVVLLVVIIGDAQFAFALNALDTSAATAFKPTFVTQAS